jgi:hypothetical protein
MESEGGFLYLGPDHLHRGGYAPAQIDRRLPSLAEVRMTNKAPSFRTLATSMLQDGGLSETERKFLSEWADHPVAERTWRTIQNNMYKHRDLWIDGPASDAQASFAHVDRGIIGQILLVKLLADRADLEWAQRGRYSCHAVMAEALLKLLKEPLAPGLPPPIPVSQDFLQKLENVARRLRLAEPENAPGGMKVSPLDRTAAAPRHWLASFVRGGAVEAEYHDLTAPLFRWPGKARHAGRQRPQGGC